MINLFQERCLGTLKIWKTTERAGRGGGGKGGDGEDSEEEEDGPVPGT